MPCSDNQGWAMSDPDEENTRLRNENYRLQDLVSNLTNDVAVYEQRSTVRGGIICGLLSELEQGMGPDEFTTFLSTVEANGQCDVTSFWLEHKKQDELRLLNDLKRKYSEHELKLIAQLLKNELL